MKNQDDKTPSTMHSVCDTDLVEYIRDLIISTEWAEAQAKVRKIMEKWVHEHQKVG